MLAKSKGDDLTEAVKGPIAMLGIALIIIGGVFAYADTLITQNTTDDSRQRITTGASDKADKKQAGEENSMFGSFGIDVLNELFFYTGIIVPLIVLGGGIVVGLTLLQRGAVSGNREHEMWGATTTITTTATIIMMLSPHPYPSKTWIIDTYPPIPHTMQTTTYFDAFPSAIA